MSASIRLGTNVPRDYFVAFFSPSKSARRKTFQPRTDWERRHFSPSPRREPGHSWCLTIFRFQFGDDRDQFLVGRVLVGLHVEPARHTQVLPKDGPPLVAAR